MSKDQNKPNKEIQDKYAGAKPGDAFKKSPQGSKANPTTTSRGADSTDKEFRNNQPNASTLKSHKSSVDLDKNKNKDKK